MQKEKLVLDNDPSNERNQDFSYPRNPNSYLTLMLSIMKSSWENFLFPFNPTLADEILSDVRASKQLPTADEIMEEFRLNGQDFEYCPDTNAPKKIVPWRKKNKKPLPTECVFCKNNGEKESYYKKHLLKDVDGRILCPVLRAYTCPNCGASGDLAHTDKYCPKGPYNPNSKSITNAFKSTKNFADKHRS